VSACGRCGSPLESGDLRCAICGQAAPAAARSATRPTASILRCEQCGAAVTYSAEAHGTRCGFCASVMRLEEPEDPVESAEWALPFLVDERAAQAALRGWLGTLGFFRPSDLARGARVDTLRPLCWAAWIFDARALVSFTADSEVGSRRSSWAPHAGQTPMEFASVLVPASRGLSHAECRRLAPLFRLDTAARAGEGGPAGMERFDVQRSTARSIIADAVQATAAARLTREGHVPGTRFRNVKVAVLLEGLSTKRVCLPTYVLAYRYRGAPYRAVVHGQDARLVFGDAPYSVGKIVLVILGGLLLVAAAVAAIVLLVARR
jgi:hypothetical protein